MKIYSRLLVALFLSLILDGSSKIWAQAMLELHQPLPVVGQFFRLTLGYNTGVAFGLFADGGVWPLAITGVVIAGLAFWFARGLYLSHIPPAAGWGIGLLLGGAIGNFADRFFDGRVIDFLDFGVGQTRWPAFNFADSFILIGLTLLMLAEARAARDTSASPIE